MNKRVDQSDDHIGRAGFFLASGTIVSRLLGFVAAILLARTLGTVGSGADAFALANQLPNNIYALIAGGILTAVLVPHIVRSGAHADGGQAYLNKIVTLGIVVFFALAALATVLAPLLIALYAQQGADGARRFSSNDIALATALAYWCLPQVFFYALYSLFGEILNAKKVFGPFTWAPVLNNLVFIIGLVVLGALFGDSDFASAIEWTSEMVATLGGAATAGIASQALVLLLFWRRAGISFRPDFRWRGVGLAQTGRAAGWLFGMILLAQIAGVVQANVATLATGDAQPGLAVLRFSWLLFMVPHSVITVSLATAYFTRIATRVRDGDHAAVIRDVSRSLRQVSAMMVIASAGLLTLSLPFATLFGGSSESIQGMSLVISGYALGLVPFSLVFVIQRVFYSMDNTKTPFLFQLVHTAAFIVFAVATSVLATSQIALGLAVSASLASLAQWVVALWALRRALPQLEVWPIVARLLGFILAAIPAVLIGLAIVYALGGFATSGWIISSAGSALVGIIAAGSAMVALYVLTLLVMKNSDMLELAGFARRLIQRLFTGRE